MRWLELIRLRTIQATAEQIARDLGAHLEYFREEAGLIGARLYGAVRPGGDFNLALLWNTERVEPGGSLAARLLIPVLREHGLVDHTVWVENDLVGFPDPTVDGRGSRPESR